MEFPINSMVIFHGFWYRLPGRGTRMWIFRRYHRIIWRLSAKIMGQKQILWLRKVIFPIIISHFWLVVGFTPPEKYYIISQLG